LFPKIFLFISRQNSYLSDSFKNLLRQASVALQLSVQSRAQELQQRFNSNAPSSVPIHRAKQFLQHGSRVTTRQSSFPHHQNLLLSSRVLERNCTRGIRRPIPDPLAFGTLVKICTACFYSNQNIAKTPNVLRFYKYSSSAAVGESDRKLWAWLQKNLACVFSSSWDPVPTYHARVRCTSCTSHSQAVLLSKKPKPIGSGFLLYNKKISGHAQNMKLLFCGKGRRRIVSDEKISRVNTSRIISRVAASLFTNMTSHIFVPGEASHDTVISLRKFTCSKLVIHTNYLDTGP